MFSNNKLIMKFKKIKNTVVAYDLNRIEMFNILKIQSKMKIEIVVNDSVIDFIYLLDRTVKNDVQHITISKSEGGDNQQVISYNELLEELNNMIKLGVPQYVFNSVEFSKKRPLIEIVGSIKSNIIMGCVYIDYEDGMFSVVNTRINRKPNKLFYWEETGSLFIFGKNGPILQYESNYNSIEDLICD